MTHGVSLFLGKFLSDSCLSSYMVHPLISMSIVQCCLSVSDRTSSVISVRTEVPEVGVCPGNLYESNDMNHVCNRMNYGPIQSHKWVLFPFLFIALSRL